jgi:alkylation response protein AidB-like acyl-CoA dehydrogenase
MDFSIPDKTQRLLETIREFVQRELFPLEAELVSIPFGELLPKLQEKRQMVRQMGLFSPQVPAAYGGMGLGFIEHALASEQLGHSPLGHFVFNAQAPDAGNMEILIHYGTDEQKRQWLQPLVRGEIRSCFAMTEPDRPGSNPTWLSTTATRAGTQYVINGHKWFTSAADGAAFAIVMAVTDPEAEPHRRASQIIVPTDTPGFRRVRNIPCMGETGEDWASHAEIVLENCRVPCENLLGHEGEGFSIAQARLGPGRIHHCMRWVGICQRSFAIMCQHAATRQLAPGDALGTRQTVENWIAESRAEIDAARLMVLHAAWKIDHEGAKSARIDISTIKFYVAGVMMRVIDRAIQTLGALGVADDTILSWFYRHERGARIYDGPDEVHKSVVARQILRQFGLANK